VPRPDGADISHYQDEPHRPYDNIDWAKFRASINDPGWFACKATQGAGYRDPTMTSFRLAAAEHNFRWRLLYHWLTPGAPAAVQANHFLSTIGALRPGEGVMLDAEEPGITEAMAVEWCQRVEGVTGRPVAVYTGVFVAGGALWNSDRLFDGRRARVLAAYTNEARARSLASPHGWDAWQWTGTGRLPGIAGDVDIDQVDHPEPFDRACGYTSIVAPPVIEVPEELDVTQLVQIHPTYVIRHVSRPARFLRVGADVDWLPSGSEVTGLVAVAGVGTIDLQDTDADNRAYDRYCAATGVPPELWG
jgi:GH25 family lysozyme M1 (1,4-beta-N-acetylmuramidase)